MAKINLLDSKIFNRIAAGEVVENPKSVVKELIENSIDSGANSITVEIRGGGIDYIRVTDDGFGMNQEDLEKSVLPHATSKVSSLEDLNHISTLGFRGEALASIASVSNLKISSREHGSALGNIIEYDFGTKVNYGSCGAPEGTSVTVQNLFDKIPARKKFFKKPSIEGAEVSAFILRAIISNYNVSIKFIADGKTVYYSDGTGLQSAIYSTYGKEFIENFVFIEHSMPDINIYGFIGKPGFAKHNRSYQTLVVNGRYVINNDITYLMQSCYKDYLMTRQFPVWIIFIEIPNDMVDVNVHPNKMDIKFSDFPKIKRCLYDTALDAVNSLSGMPANLTGAINQLSHSALGKVNCSKNSETNEYAGKIQGINTIFRENISNDSNNIKIAVDNIKNTSFHEKTAMSRLLNSKTFFSFENKDVFDHHTTINKPENHNDENIFTTNAVDAEKINQTIGEKLAHQIALGDYLEIKILCKIFNTYILIEYDNDAYIIDQHAAHERLIFDELMAFYDEGSPATQPLLLPYTFHLPSDEGQILCENIDILDRLGFPISKFSGNSYSLGAVPCNCIGINCNEFIKYFFENLGKNTLRESDLIKEKAIKSACKAAVKGRDDLSENEINSLLRQMLRVEKFFCPHGRPIIVKITKNEIEKWFKRA